MRLFFGLFLLGFVGWLLVSLLIARLRRIRGEAPPPSKGPKAITIACIVLVTTYVLLVLWRLQVDGWQAFGG